MTSSDLLRGIWQDTQAVKTNTTRKTRDIFDDLHFLKRLRIQLSDRARTCANRIPGCVSKRKLKVPLYS